MERTLPLKWIPNFEDCLFYLVVCEKLRRKKIRGHERWWIDRRGRSSVHQGNKTKIITRIRKKRRRDNTLQRDCNANLRKAIPAKIKGVDWKMMHRWMERGRGVENHCQIWDDQVTHGNGETLRVLTWNECGIVRKHGDLSVQRKWRKSERKGGDTYAYPSLVFMPGGSNCQMCVARGCLVRLLRNKTFTGRQCWLESQSMMSLSHIPMCIFNSSSILQQRTFLLQSSD